MCATYCQYLDNVRRLPRGTRTKVIFSLRKSKQVVGDERKITTQITGPVILNRRTALVFKHVLSTLQKNVFLTWTNPSDRHNGDHLPLVQNTGKGR
jgi:hypothetical protein